VTAVVVFAVFVALTLGISFAFAARTRSARGYFAAHGEIHWAVNGIAFAGDYLSAASFLGICGMIAFYGYDGFLYSIGYLAGWIVALFVVAEPLKRLGKYTFADALDSRFQSRGLRLAVAASTLAVSLFYLIPQMVGAGVLIQPLLGFPHHLGVLLVGAVVILIVTTAGMVSTTYVQFLKGSLLVVFSLVLTVLILQRGLSTDPHSGGKSRYRFRTLGPVPAADLQGRRAEELGLPPGRLVPLDGGWAGKPYLRVQDEQTGRISVWRIDQASGGEPGSVVLHETQTVRTPGPSGGQVLVNGLPRGRGEGEADLWPVGHVSRLPDGQTDTGPLGPFAFLRTVQRSEVVLWGSDRIQETDGSTTVVYYPRPTPGSAVLRPGNHPSLRGIRSDRLTDKLNFLSLMLALFCGTASLPHILIRYYTVKDQASARNSTVVGIASIGFFYVLTLFLGLGAMTSGALDVTDSNMAAPLLARSFGELMFAVISAIAFTTVLGTVSGLIVAASGAVAHDLLAGFFRLEMHDAAKVRAGKLTAVVVGLVAIGLGILFQKMNVNYLVGWAFSVAASANLPALVMLLFWRGTTKQGVIAAVLVGMASSLAWILLSGDTYRDVYGLPGESAVVPFSQPGIVTIPLGFVTLVAVSVCTRDRGRVRAALGDRDGEVPPSTAGAVP
jgi:cation/acetate symporter